MAWTEVEEEWGRHVDTDLVDQAERLKAVNVAHGQVAGRVANLEAEIVRLKASIDSAADRADQAVKIAERSVKPRGLASRIIEAVQRELGQ
jgi:hypothetical protein